MTEFEIDHLYLYCEIWEVTGTETPGGQYTPQGFALGTKLFLYRVTETPTLIQTTQIPDFHKFGMGLGCAFMITISHEKSKEVLQYLDRDGVSNLLEFCSRIDQQGEELENFYINFLRLYTGFTEDQLSTIIKNYEKDGDLSKYIIDLIGLERNNQNVG